MKKIKLFFVFVLTIALSTTVFALNLTEFIPVIEIPVQDKVEIPLNELPSAISDLLENDFAGYTVDKAYTSEKEGNTVYYVNLSKDGQIVTILFDKDGNVIEEG